MGRSIITAHAKGALQEPQDRGVCRVKAGEILEITEYKMCGLLVVVTS